MKGSRFQNLSIYIYNQKKGMGGFCSCGDNDHL